MKFNRGNVVRTVAVIGVVAAAVAVSANAVSAHSWVGNRITFSQPVALPGVTLAQGTYTFEIGGDRNGYVFELEKPQGPGTMIVRVTSGNGRTVYQGFALRVPRPAGLRPDQVITLGEGPLNAPPPINAWYPLGEQYGHKFVW